MNTKLRLLFVMGVSLCTAALAPALLACTLGESIRWLPITFYVALAHAVVLGIPAVILAWQFNWVSLGHALAAGFIIGAIGVAVVFWPAGTTSTSSAGGVAMVVDGVPTLAGWLRYAGSVCSFGGFGALGGLTFWGCLKAGNVLPSPKHKTAKPRLLLFLVLTLFVSLVLTKAHTPQDTSCHKVLRDGRTSIRSEMNIALEVDATQWPEVAATFRAFAQAQNLSFRDSSQQTPDVVKVLALSLCNDFVTMSVNEQRWKSKGWKDHQSPSSVDVRVYEVASGFDWPVVVEQLIDELETRWPGKVYLRSRQGERIPVPVRNHQAN